MMRAFLILCVFLGLTPSPSAALSEVDVELFLAVDVSRSMTRDELEIQRRGYAEALSSPPVVKAIQGGMLGRVAITYVEWAGNWSQNVVVPWTVIETPEQAQELADILYMAPAASMRRTSISGVLDYAEKSILENDYIGLRAVIDVSGDGPNNQGDPVPEARDRLLSQGMTINGLPLMTRDGMGSAWHIDDLDVYYRECVIGGPGSFVIPVYDWSQFATAIQRKLVLEIAALPTLLHKAQYQRGAGYDCLIGEKIRIRRQQEWDSY